MGGGRAVDNESAFTVHRQDAREVGRLLDRELFEGQQVMATVTSPPYFNLLNYGGQADQIGYGQQYEAYLDDCQDVFQQLFDRSADEGSLWIIADTLLDQSHSPSRLRNLPFDLASRCEQAGWVLREVIIWHKEKTRPWSNAGRLRNAFEYILYLVKTDKFKYNLDRIREPSNLGEWWVKYPERYNPRGKAPENVWRFAIPNQGSWSNSAVSHACPLPPNLIERILLLSTDDGDIVCDPFAGSGTVVAEAERLKRLGIGTELNPEYVEAYRRIVRREIVGRPRVNDLSTMSKMSAELEDKVTKLRAVKIARATWHQFRKLNPNELPLPSHVIALATKKQSSATPNIQDVSLIFVLDATPDQRHLLQAELKEIVRVPPLTKYGIAGDVRVVSPAESAHLLKGVRLWLYEHGHTWHTVGPVSPEDLLSEGTSDRRMRYPPIASNIEVRISLGDRPGEISSRPSEPDPLER